MTFATALPPVVLSAAFRVAAGWPPLPPTLAGPLLGALLSRFAGVDIVCAVEAGAGLLLALAWVTAPALIDVAPCDAGAGAETAVQ